jgi:gluconolactonase
MKVSRRSLLAAGSGFALSGCGQSPNADAQAGGSLGGVTVLSDTIADLVPEGAVVEELGSGYLWSEGPVWVKDGNYLLFTDVPGNVMYKWTEAGGVEEFMRPSGFAGEDSAHLRESGANGLAIDLDGKLVYADTGNRNISRLDLATMEKTVVVDRYNGKRFNSPNDLVVHSSGAIYFTDPPYGLAEMNASTYREIGFNGVYRLAPDGSIAVIETALTFPNGIALSPDEQTLYVSSSDTELPIITAYALGEDGMPASQRLLFDAKPLYSDDAPGNPDGLAVDEAGRLFQSGPGGVLILSPEGELLGVINPGRACANCKFGEDGSTLFLTAHDKLARIRLNTRAARW